MVQGVDQRASNGRKQLEVSHPYISRKLKENGDLDLLYFVIKDPMKKHLEAIKEAVKSPMRFEDAAKKRYAQ